MADLLFSLRKLALSPSFVNVNLSESKEMRVGSLWNDLPWFCDVFQAAFIGGWLSVGTAAMDHRFFVFRAVKEKIQIISCLYEIVFRRINTTYYPSFFFECF